MARRRILVAECDADMRAILKYNLENIGYCVETAGSSGEILGMDLLLYDLLIVEIPNSATLGRYLKRCREDRRFAAVPVIFLKDRDASIELPKGFACMDKPFSINEMVAKVGKAIRPGVIEAGGLAIKPSCREVIVMGEKVELSGTEYGLLHLLASNGGKVFSRSEIVSYLWPSASHVGPKTVDVNMVRLRKKLGPCAGMIVTHPGVGYGFSHSSKDTPDKEC